MYTFFCVRLLFSLEKCAMINDKIILKQYDRFAAQWPYYRFMLFYGYLCGAIISMRFSESGCTGDYFYGGIRSFDRRNWIYTCLRDKK